MHCAARIALGACITWMSTPLTTSTRAWRLSPLTFLSTASLITICSGTDIPYQPGVRRKAIVIEPH